MCWGANGYKNADLIISVVLAVMGLESFQLKDH